MIGLVVAAQSESLKHYDQGRQPHGELWEQIMEGNGKGEVETVN